MISISAMCFLWSTMAIYFVLVNCFEPDNCKNSTKVIVMNQIFHKQKKNIMLNTKMKFCGGSSNQLENLGDKLINNNNYYYYY